MDIVHDNISNELPYDAVSKGINESVTQYKDGKDTSLYGGEKDRKIKSEILNEFYSNLKKALAISRKDNEEVQIGTSIGNYLINKDNDMVEKAVESFGTEVKPLVSMMSLILKNQVIPSCGLCIKMNKDVKDLTNKDFTKKLPRLSKRTDISDIEKTYVKNILENVLGSDKMIECGIDSLRDYTRDVINIFVKNGDNVDYFKRYIKRYQKLSDITSKVALAVNEMLLSFKDIFNTTDLNGASSERVDTEIKKIIKLSKQIDAVYDELTSSDYTNDDDYFVWMMQKYKLDVSTFTAKQSDSIKPNVGYDGSTKADLFKAIDSNFNNLTDNENEKTIFACIKNAKNLQRIISEVGSEYSNINLDSIMAKEPKNLSFVDDITVGEFYSQMDNFNNKTGVFREKADETVKSLIDSITRVANITGKLSTTVQSMIIEYNKINAKSNYKLATLVLSIASWTCLDLVSTMNAMHYINSYDMVMKLYLYESFVIINKYIDDCIQSWRKK